MAELTDHQRGALTRLRRIDPAAERLTVDTAGLTDDQLGQVARMLTTAAGNTGTEPVTRWLTDLADRLTRTRQARP
jgi:hypothetical protein